MRKKSIGALCRRDPSCFLPFLHSVHYVPDLHYGLAHPALSLKAVSVRGSMRNVTFLLWRNILHPCLAVVDSGMTETVISLRESICQMGEE